MATWIWIVIAIAVVIVVGLAVVGAGKRRTAMLRDRFGPEYDRAVENSDDQRAAEADLRAREKQRAQFDVKPLPEATACSSPANGVICRSASSTSPRKRRMPPIPSLPASWKRGVTR